MQLGADPLQQPEPHNVFQHAIAFGAALVGDVRLKRVRGGVRQQAFESHQRPGAGTEVGRVVLGQRRGEHRAGSVVGGDGDDRDLDAAGVLPAADNIARRRGFAEPGGRRACPVKQFGIPFATFDIQQLRGGGVGVLPVKLARQAIVQIVGDHQRVGDLLFPVRLSLAQGAELIEGIERQKLNAGAGVNRLFAQLAQRLLHHAVGAFVAIAHRFADAVARFIQQHHIDAPGVDADAVRHDVLLVQLRQPGADFALQMIEIPAVIAGATFATAGETTHFAQIDLL